MDGVDVYSTAKSEYTEQFCIFLVPALQTYFLGLVDEAKEKEKDNRKVLWMFQNLLKDIPDWNQDKVIRETEKIVSSSKCDYLEELLTAVFIAHTKVLSAIRLTNRDKKKIQITVPKLEHFLHRTLSESARILWSNAYLFSEQGTSIERQKNLRQVEMLLHQAVLQSIRSMLPVKSILREYLNSDDTEEEKPATAAEEEEETEKKEEEAEEEEADAEEATQVDISGAVQESIVKEEASPIAEVAPTPAPPSTPEPVVNPQEEKKSVENIPSETTVQQQAPQQQPQVLVFDTEPSVKFSDHDTVFDHENPEGNKIVSKGSYDEEEEMDGIQILDTPPEMFDDFEDLEQKPSTVLASEDFETLE